MDHTAANPGVEGGAIEPKPFVWPPVPDAPVAVPPPPAQESVPGRHSARTRKNALRKVVREAEAWWLAPTALPLSRRAADVGWSPDALSEFCNRCAQTVGLGEDDEFGCASCRGRRLVWSRAVRLGAYSGDLAEWVREVKFQRNASLGVDLGRALAERLAAAGLPDERVCVVPVPMSARDRLFRGVDHARCVAEGVAKGLRAPLVRALLRRHGPSQREMPSATARERNVRRAFTLRRGVDLSGWTAVLVDDVITTGATMRAASRTLWPRRLDSRPASIWAAAVGVTPDPSRLAESPGRAAGEDDA